MNWTEISKKYPKIFEVFKKWAVDVSKIDMSLHDHIEFDHETFEINNYRYSARIQDRDLYDFFDSIRMLVILKPFDNGDFSYEIHSFERYNPDGAFGNKGNHTTELGEGGDTWEERITAETHAFNHAFKLAEKYFEDITKYVLNQKK